MKIKFTAVFLLVCLSSAFSQMRSFNDIFPNLSEEIRSSVFRDSGYINSSQKKSGLSIIAVSNSNLDRQIINNILHKNPGYVVESISVISVNADNVTLLDVYNAISNIRGLKGRLYNSATRNQAVPLFEDATRIVSEKQTSAVADPAPASVLPRSETVYIRLKDVNFGNTYYRAELALNQNGLSYTLSNFRNMTYLLVPVIKEGKFTAQLYIEPIQEGVLIYSIAGAEISDFFASRIHVDSAIAKRLAVITDWAAEGIINRNR